MRFCPNCGKKTEQASGDAHPYTEKHPASTSRTQNTPLWFKILIAVIAVGALIAVVAYQFSDNIEEVVDSQLNSIRDNKITEAYYGFTSKDFQNATSLETFKDFIKVHPALSQNKSFTSTNRTIKNNIGILEGTLTAEDNNETPVEFTLIKEEGKWKILGINFTAADGNSNPPAQESKPSSNEKDPTPTPTGSALSKPGKKINITSSAQLYTPVAMQLRAIQNSDLSTAYNELSAAEFKMLISPLDFKAIVDRHPILSSFSSYDFKKHSFEKNLGTVLVILDPRDKAIPIEYRLIKEDGNWKILSFNAIDQSNENNPLGPDQNILAIANVSPSNNVQKTPENNETFNSAAIEDMIKSQISYLKMDDLVKAYSSAFTTKGLRDATNLNDFGTYVQNHPALILNKSIDFNKFTMKNGTLTINVVFIDSDTEKYPAAYTLAKEDGKWKIDHFEVADTPLPVSETQPQPKAPGQASPMELAKAVFGTQVDNQGIVQIPQATFKSSAGYIFINVYVKNGQAGTKIDQQLIQKESGIRSAVGSTKLQKNGDAVLSFGYPAPTGGWSKGTYQLAVKSSTGVETTFVFTVD